MNKRMKWILSCMLVFCLLCGVCIGYLVGKAQIETTEITEVSMIQRGSYGQILPEDTTLDMTLTVDENTAWIYDESKLQTKAALEAFGNNLFALKGETSYLYSMGEYLLFLQRDEKQVLQATLYKRKTKVPTFYGE